MEFLYQSLFKSWKTSVTALVGGTVWLLGQNGIMVTPEQSQAVIVVAMLVIGLFAKDATSTHTQE